MKKSVDYKVGDRIWVSGSLELNIKNKMEHILFMVIDKGGTFRKD